MPRSRNIKPSFFANDELAEIEPLGRLLFIGLWTIADFKGELEWRPKKIKAQVLPYDNCDITEIAINLDKSGFIRFYSNAGVKYVNIPNFERHQNPHKNERQKGSSIPRYEESTLESIDLEPLEENHDLSRLNHDSYGTDRADSCFLIPDSCSLIPDSNTQPKPELSAEEIEDLKLASWMFETLKTENPKHKKPNIKKWANTIRLMRTIDSRGWQEIADVWQWARNDNFWCSNILSPEKLRKQFDALLIKQKANTNSQPDYMSKTKTVLDNLEL